MRMGIVGTGQISGWFVQACRQDTGVEPVAICSRTPEAGRAFAAAHGLEHVFTSVDELAASPLIDAVYIASPIGAHHGQIRTALSAGRPVLCEKTLGVDLAQLLDVLHEAHDRELVLLEAVRTIHDPVLDVVAQHLPELGHIWHARFEKCQYSSRYDSYRQGTVLNAFNPALGNSALADIGVYCVQPAVRLFGAPNGIDAVSHFLPNGFEASGAIHMAYDTLSVCLRYSKVTSSVAPSVIEGEDGTLTIDSIGEPAVVQLHRHDGSVETLNSGPAARPWDDLRFEIERFRELVEAGDHEHEFCDVSRQSMEIMEEARRQNPVRGSAAGSPTPPGDQRQA